MTWAVKHRAANSSDDTRLENRYRYVPKGREFWVSSENWDKYRQVECQDTDTGKPKRGPAPMSPVGLDESKRQNSGESGEGNPSTLYCDARVTLSQHS